MASVGNTLVSWYGVLAKTPGVVSCRPSRRQPGEGPITGRRYDLDANAAPSHTKPMSP